MQIASSHFLAMTRFCVNRLFFLNNLLKSSLNIIPQISLEIVLKLQPIVYTVFAQFIIQG